MMEVPKVKEKAINVDRREFTAMRLIWLDVLVGTFIYCGLLFCIFQLLG